MKPKTNKVAPSVKDPQVAAIIFKEIQLHKRHTHSVLSGAYVPKVEEKVCCSIQ